MREKKKHACPTRPTDRPTDRQDDLLYACVRAEDHGEGEGGGGEFIRLKCSYVPQRGMEKKHIHYKKKKKKKKKLSLAR